MQLTLQGTGANAALTDEAYVYFEPGAGSGFEPAFDAEKLPNPAKTQVAIELPAALRQQPVAATLLDALGRVVRQQALPAGLPTNWLLMINIAEGVYSLHLTTEAGPIVKKLVIEVRADSESVYRVLPHPRPPELLRSRLAGRRPHPLAPSPAERGN